MNSKYYFLLVLLVFLSFSCNKELKEKQIIHNKEDNLNLEEEKTSLDVVEEIEFSCQYKPSNEKSSNIFPFSKSDKIIAISFQNLEVKPYDYKSLLSENILVDSLIDESIDITSSRDSLFAIFFDYEGEARISADCYNPRHTILFYAQDDIIAYYEVCFECDDARSSFSFPGICIAQSCTMQRFLKKVGLQKNFMVGPCPD